MQYQEMWKRGIPHGITSTGYPLPAMPGGPYDYSNKSVLQNDFLTAKQMNTDRATAMCSGQQAKDSNKMTSEQQQQQQQQILALAAAQGKHKPHPLSVLLKNIKLVIILASC